MTDNLVKRPDDEQDDLTLVYMWAYKMAEKKYKSRIEELEEAMRWVLGTIGTDHPAKKVIRVALGEKKDA